MIWANCLKMENKNIVYQFHQIWRILRRRESNMLSIIRWKFAKSWWNCLYFKNSTNSNITEALRHCYAFGDSEIKQWHFVTTDNWYNYLACKFQATVKDQQHSRKTKPQKSNINKWMLMTSVWLNAKILELIA